MVDCEDIPDTDVEDDAVNININDMKTINWFKKFTLHFGIRNVQYLPDDIDGSGGSPIPLLLLLGPPIILGGSG